MPSVTVPMRSGLKRYEHARVSSGNAKGVINGIGVVTCVFRRCIYDLKTAITRYGERVLGTLSPGDMLFMYVSKARCCGCGCGCVAQQFWDRCAYRGRNRLVYRDTEYTEYRIGVDWCLKAVHNPIRPADLRAIIGWTPMPTVLWLRYSVLKIPTPLSDSLRRYEIGHKVNNPRFTDDSIRIRIPRFDASMLESERQK